MKTPPPMMQWVAETENWLISFTAADGTMRHIVQRRLDMAKGLFQALKACWIAEQS